jgi:hypothetical protein
MSRVLQIICGAVAAFQVCASAQAQSNYNILSKGSPAGRATLDQRLLPGGGKSVSLVMTLRQGESRIVVKTETTYARSGRAIHAEQGIYPFGQPAVKEVSVEFDREGAHVTKTEKGVHTTVTAPLKSDWPTQNESMFWFLSVFPKVGEIVTAYVFNLDTLKWEKSVTTFEGKTHKGELIHLERGASSVETAVDPDGYPHTITDSRGVELDRE